MQTLQALKSVRTRVLMTKAQEFLRYIVRTLDGPERWTTLYHLTTKEVRSLTKIINNPRELFDAIALVSIFIAQHRDRYVGTTPPNIGDAQRDNPTPPETIGETDAFPVRSQEVTDATHKAAIR
jgi:hypothetical protein